MADGVRGNQYLAFNSEIQKGIVLHRAIDTFTDAHPLFRKCTKRLHSEYHHYSGVIVDIFYDHFLAKNWHNYSATPLPHYCENFYKSLTKFHDKLPLKVQEFVPYMISDNWLLSYASINGIQKVLNGMNKRTKNKSKMNLAIEELQNYYDAFELEFTLFFKDLFFYSKNELKILSSQRLL